MSRRPDSNVRRADLFAILFGLAVLAYATARAVLVPITHDEAFTFLHWSTAPWRAIFLFEAPERANNHLLNTVLMKISSALFGPGEVALRLPNLLALASYLVSLWLLLRRFAAPALAISGLVLASANRHLLELFSLARGYGLCLGLLLPGLYFAAVSIEESDDGRREEWLALGVISLSVLAQFIALDAFGALVAVLVLTHATRARPDDPESSFGRRLARRLAPLLVTSATLSACLGGILWRISSSGGFYTGGTTGLWHDVVENLVWLTLLPAPWLGPVQKPLLVLVAVLLVFLCGTGARLLVRSPRTATERVALAFIALLALTVLAVKAQSVLFGLRYPTDRIAIPFIPLFVLAVTLGAATAPPAVRKAATILLGGLALLGTILLVQVADTRRSALWWFDADVRSSCRTWLITPASRGVHSRPASARSRTVSRP
jgi:mannosyltransferase